MKQENQNHDKQVGSNHSELQCHQNDKASYRTNIKQQKDQAKDINNTQQSSRSDRQQDKCRNPDYQSYVKPMRSIKILYQMLKTDILPYKFKKSKQGSSRVGLLLSLIGLLALNSGAVQAMGTTTLASQCSQISMMPGEIFVTYAQDMRPEDLSQYTLFPQDSSSNQGLVDIHQFNQYFTFQIDKHSNHKQVEGDEPSSIQTSFFAPKSSGEGFLIKIKSELSSAFSDQVQQGMRVSLVDASQGNYGILVDGTSLDNDMGSVYLESASLEDGKEYIIRYDLYDKEIVSNSEELGSLSQSTSNVMCKLPFITQELLIIDKKLAKHRIAQYNQNPDPSNKSIDLSVSGIQCEFDHLNNTLDMDYGEDGIFCEQKLYTYQTNTQTTLKTYADRYNADKQYSVIYEHQFSVRGAKNELITYWYEMLVGVNFLVSSSLKVMLTRVDKEFENEDPFSCMYDKSCVVATMSQKNEIKLDLILTSGKYKIRIIDEESKELKTFLNQESNLQRRPFSFRLNSYPILQNENRVNCPHMYMEKDFIQQRFIENKRGLRFTYSDKIIMNIFNLTQQIDFIPEQDMILKIRIKEAYGVNTEMVLCEGEDCITMSSQIGTTEVLFGQLKKGKKYYVEMSFAKSLIQMSEFFTCPHFQIEISMISLSDADSMIKKLTSQGKANDFDSQEALSNIFGNITKGDASDGFAFIDHEQIFKFNVDQSNSLEEKKQNYEVTSVRFIVEEKSQLFVEIFYDPFFYDLELSLISNDATNVRSHITKDPSTNVASMQQSIDWSLYKGSKKIFVEVEPGSYDLKIVQKLPSISDSSLLVYQPSIVQFQIYLIFAQNIERQQILPPTLNYFGMIGPNGQEFGEFTYHCQDCILENSRYKIIEFQVQNDAIKGTSNDVNFNAEISSPDRDVEVVFEAAQEGVSKRKYGDYDVIFDDQTKKGYALGNKMRLYKGTTQETEESISAQKLKPHQKYRVVILNNGDETKITFSLRIELIENPLIALNANKNGGRSILPSSIDEIKREKIKSEGVKESEFIIGNRFMMKWMDEEQLYPFVRKSQKVYQTQQKDPKTNDQFLISLPFEVKEEQSQVYASVMDYSGVAGLGLMIVMANDVKNSWEVASVPGKYHSYIEPVTLTRGHYILVVSPMTDFDYDQPQTMIRFSLDFLYERENTTDALQQFILNTMELCNIPSLPKSLSPSQSPSYVHPLSGQSMSHQFQMKMMDVYSDDSIEFEVTKSSLVTVYLETPKDVHTDIEIVKTKGTYRRKASSRDLNKESDNFLKAQGYKHMNIVQLRDFVTPGSYKLKIFATDSQGYNSQTMPRCQSATLHFSVAPIEKAKAKITDQCTEAVQMGQKLQFGQYIHGKIIMNSASQIFDSSYISLEDQGEGPFFLYFQIQYDQRAEGGMGLALYKHDKGSQSFTETQTFAMHDYATYLLAIVEQGTYVLAVQSLSSNSDKYTISTALQRSDPNIKLLHNPCLNMSFSYYVTSAINHDTQSVDLSLADILFGLFSADEENNKFAQLATQYNRDKTLRQEFQDILSTSCKYEELPQKLQATESGYDNTYNLMFTRKSYETMDILVEEDSLVKIMFSMKNPRNSLNAFLYDSSEMKNLLTYTQPSHSEKELTLTLKAQKKAYKLKIIEDSLDESDPCPTYQMRIALKPLKLVLDENLKCTGLAMPSPLIKVVGENYALEGEYALSNEFINKYKRSQDAELTYDIKIKVPNATKDYYFDIETKNDFLTSEIEFSAFAIGTQDQKDLVKIGESSQYDEGLQDVSMISDQGNQRNIIKRLKLNNIREQVDPNMKLSEFYILRLKFSTKMQALLQTLQNKNLLTLNTMACFSFDLSVRVTQVIFNETNYTPDTDPTENELIRIDWSNKMQDQLFDPRQKLSVFLQFKESMKEEYKTLKFTPFAYLYPVEDSKTKSQVKSGTNTSTSDDLQEKRIYPETVRLSTIDKSSLVLTFMHNIFLKGTCYKLVLDTKLLGVRFDETAFKMQNQMCTTKCSCNTKGMKECDETSGQCICHEPFTGDECNQCIKGFVFDPTTSDCHPASKCKENGGQEDCNGHGTCYEEDITGQAKCICERGFEDDGLDLCSKCADPLFSYPHCESRNWIIEESQYNCQKLPTNMPVYLYNNSDKNATKVYQNQEGLAFWTGIYKVSPPQNRQKLKTQHHFIVPTNSIVRLFMDTHDSGLRVKFKILDDKKRVLSQSNPVKFEASQDLGNQNTDMLFLPVTQVANGQDPLRNPFLLEIEYEFDKLEMGSNICHMLEVILIVQPQERMSQYLKCSQEEINESRENKQYQFNFNQQPYFFNEKFTLTSDMKPGSNLGHISEVNAQFIVMKLDINVAQSGNALSFIARYSLEKVVMELTLKDKKTGNIVATEKYASLEDFEVQGEQNQAMTDDMLSYIEISNIDQGDYELEILISKALFLSQLSSQNSYTAYQPNCLSFDLTLEYVPRQISSQWQTTPININDLSESAIQQLNKFEVVSVLPNQIQEMKRGRKTKISLKVGDKILASDANSLTKGLEQFIYLQGISEPEMKINPSSVIVTDEDTLSIFFNMNNNKLKNVTKEMCFKLVLSDEQFKPFSIETRYCIKPASQENEILCNPNSLSKIVNNQCVCNHPYKGPTCELCATGYNPTIDPQNKHTVCLLDLSKCSEDICNNHGRCTQVGHSSKGSLSDFKCECDQKFTGLYCEKCKDPQFAYPDCSTVRAETFEVDFEQDTLKRRQYNKDGYQKGQSTDRNIQQMIKGDLKQQCQISTYPTDLDRVEFMNALQGGEMHLADYYTINHDTDNLIKFTPKSQGIIKIFIQQPEFEESQVNDETFDIEIGVYDPQSNKFLATSINQHLDFKDNKQLLNGKLDYSWLQFQIPYDHLNKPLYLIFRAVNFTIKSDELLSECESVYLEIQYTETKRPCQNNPDLKQNNEIVKVSANTPYRSWIGNSNMQQSTSINNLYAPFYTIRDSQKQFFYYQDIYLGDQYQSSLGQGKESDYEVKISVHQKFIEENMIDFMVEVLEEGVAYGDIDFRKYSANNVQDKPECKNICLLSGQKAYNEFHNIIQISAQSLVRVWLHQTTKEGQCANYQLFIEANKIVLSADQLESLDQLRCEELDLPLNLNTNRYLGDINSPVVYNSDNSEFGTSKQKNFHYLERFRVDNLKNNQAHAIEFTLNEPSLLRVATTVHKHIEFDIALNEIQSNGYARKLIDSKAKNFEDSIFVQLDKGKYQLQLLFLSEEFYMQQPCQSIQMELGIVKMSDAKNQISRPQSKLQAQPRLVLDDLLQSVDHTQLIHTSTQQTLQSFALIDKNIASNYESYLELSNQKFTIPKMKNLGLIITIRSDFMLNNVNFALTNINNQRLFHNTRRENQVHLVANDIPGGEYELLIYAHNSLSNIQRESDMIRQMEVWYQIDFNFIKWVQTDDFIQHYLYVDIMDRTIKSEMDTLFQKEYKCFQDYMQLESEITPSLINHGKIDINYEAMIPSVQRHEHVMEYTPVNGQNGLRIIVDYSTVKISIKRSQSDRDSITESFALNNGDQQILMIQDLQQNQKYYVIYEFTQDQQENQELFQSDVNVCQNFRIQIESFKMSDQCLRQSGSIRNDIVLIQDQFDRVIMHQTTSVKSDQPIEIRNSNQTELWITLDFSTVFFLPTIRLTKQAKDAKDTKNMMVIKPQEIYSDIQELMIFKFTNLNPGTYFINIIQYTKPRDCLNILPLRLQSQPMNKGVLLQQTNYGFIKTYTSQDEIQTLNRFVQPLPISLDTYKYLIDEEYMLVSEYIQTESDKSENNVIKFKVSNRDDRQVSYFKIYIENSEVLMTLKSKSTDKAIESMKTNIVQAKLTNGDYELTFEYTTKQAMQKASIFKNSFHITIMIVSQPYYERNYVAYQGQSLKNCKQNTNFPLALSKQTSLQYFQNEVAFDYQLLRLSDKVLRDSYALDNYKFRVNETSRFYMTLGMHSIAHMVNMRVTEINGYGNQYMGKQEFNLQVIDVILSAGDYQVTIEQPIAEILGDDQEVCGIFSFHGRITPIQNYISPTGLLTTTTKCQVKEVLPSEIYQSQSKTKNGLEPYINSDGTFNQAYEDILIRKNRQSLKKPEFDRIQLNPPEDSLLSILLQYKSKQNEIIVKLYDAYSFTDKSSQALVESVSESQKGTLEQNLVFKLEKNRQYFLFIYYKGEQLIDQYTNQEVCEYYNAFISIDTMTRLASEFTCIQNADSTILSLMRDLPKRITDSDLRDGQYTFRDFTQLKYPQDYHVNQQNVKGDEHQLLKSMEIKLNDKFTVDAQIKFDFPYAMFDLTLFDNLLSDDNDPLSNPEDYQMVAEQLPISYNQQDFTNPTLTRTIKASQPLRERNVYYLMFSDDTSHPIMETLYQHLLQQAGIDKSKVANSLCLYTEVDITIKKQQTQMSQSSISSMQPQILQINPNAVSDNSQPILIQRTQNQLRFNIAFNKAPFMRNTQILPSMKTATKQQLAELINLQVLNPYSKDLMYAKKPARVLVDNTTLNGPVGISLFFDISEEMQPGQPQVVLKPYIDLDNMVDSQNQKFKQSPNIHMPQFSFADKLDNNQKKQQQENKMSQLDQTKQQIIEQQKRLKDLDLNKNSTFFQTNTNKNKQQEVKCLCVHGKCKDGEKYCNKCDQGWTGKLCDIPLIEDKEQSNINNQDGENNGYLNRRKNKFKKDGSQMVRDRSGREDIETEVKIIDDSSSTSYKQTTTPDSVLLDNDSNKGRYNNKRSQDRQSYADTTIYKNQDILDRQREQLIQNDEISLAQRNAQQQPGIFSRLFKVIKDLILTGAVIGVVVGIAYLLLKKSKIKEYMPVPINERDDEHNGGPSRQLELTEFNKSKKKSSSGRSSQQQKLSSQSSRKSSTTTDQTSKQQQQKSQDQKLRTVDFPKDIRDQLKNQQKEQKRLLTEDDEAFDEQTKQLTSELELYANDDEESHSGQRLNEPSTQAKPQILNNPFDSKNVSGTSFSPFFDANQQDNLHNEQQQQLHHKYQQFNTNQSNVTTSGMVQGYDQDYEQQQNHYSSSSDQQPQYYDSQSLASSSQQFINTQMRQDEQYNPFSYVDLDNVMNQNQLPGGDKQQPPTIQPQQLSEIVATSHEIDSVLQEMQDMEDDDEDEDDESKRLF